MSEIRHRFVEEARSFLGVPWKHQGRSDLGLDCVGLILISAKRVGFQTPEVTGYSRHARGIDFIEIFRKHMISVPLRDSEIGDVLIFTETVYPCHCGVLSEKRGLPSVIHADVLRRRVLEETLEGELKRKMIMSFRLPNG